MTRKEIVLNKLLEITEKEWSIVAKKCRTHIKARVKHKTLFGAHCEDRLGMTAEDYYFQKAVLKLYEYEPENRKGWEWQFEKYSIFDQLLRIIDSMMSEEVRKVKTVKSDKLKIRYTDDDSFLENFMSEEDVSKEHEEKIQKFIELVEDAIKGDNELEMLYLYRLDGKRTEEIAVEMGLEIKKVYKLAEKMKDKILKHASIVNSNDKMS